MYSATLQHFLGIHLSRTRSCSLLHLHLGPLCRRSRAEPAVSRQLIIRAVCLPPARGPLHCRKCNTTCSSWPFSSIRLGEVGLRLADPFSLGHVMSSKPTRPAVQRGITQQLARRIWLVAPAGVAPVREVLPYSSAAFLAAVLITDPSRPAAARGIRPQPAPASSVRLCSGRKNSPIRPPPFLHTVVRAAPVSPVCSPCSGE